MDTKLFRSFGGLRTAVDNQEVRRGTTPAIDRCAVALYLPGLQSGVSRGF